MEPDASNMSIEEAAKIYFEHQDEAALQNVIHASENLIHFYGHLYGKGFEKEDLFQTGCLGLLKALKGYDSTREASFVTYASHLIMGEIRHMVRKQVSYYRPGCIVELQSKVDKVVEAYAIQYGDVPSISHIAETLKVREEAVGEVMKAGLVSMDEIDLSKIHSTAYETFKLPIEDRITLYQAFKRLTAIQQKVIQMLFFQDLSQQQVADEMKISQKNVSRIKQRSLKEMHDYLMEDRDNVDL
jgi:RNA polymerase sigma-B factor